MVSLRAAVAGLVILTGAALAPAAGAVELRGGVLRQDFDDLWSAGQEFEQGWALNAELGLDPIIDLGLVDLSPFLGGTWTPGSEVDKVYAGLGLELGGGPLFFRVGLGAALHNGDSNDPKDYGRRRQFGSDVLFHIPVEAGIGLVPGVRLSLYFDHMSNGNLDDINPGMDTLGVRLGVGF
ncbi:MAG TPA: acyloxyacyl hydrolase [Azospirillaceae bacterium]|nr:acyloxyacyl hydrolase [Azospirillaceae bacterium]